MRQVSSGMASMAKVSGGTFYVFAGNAGVAGALITPDDASIDPQTANDDGDYFFSIEKGKTVTFTPTLEGYTFEPTSKTVTSIAENTTGQDFVASPNTFSISGNVGVANVKVYYGDGIEDYVLADGSGDYIVEGIALDSTVTLIPVLDDYGFTPERNTYTSVSEDHDNEDYTTSTAYYVRKTGNDGTGDGSYSNPWLTVAKALSMASSGNTIFVGDGDYNQSGAQGCFEIARVFTSWVTIMPEDRENGNVNIHGSSYGQNIWFNGGASAYIKFKYLTLGSYETAYVNVRIKESSVDHISFESCTFIGNESTGSGGIYIAPGNGITASNISFINCDLVDYMTGVFNIQPTGTGVVTDLDITNCTLTGTWQAFYFVSVDTSGSASLTNCTLTGSQAVVVSGATVNITDCICNGSSALSSVSFGTDGTSGIFTAGTLTNVTINKNPAVAGHTLIFGAGCVNCVADNVTIPESYDYGIVVKQNTGAEIKNCTVSAPFSALYFKGATSANAHHNTLTSSGLATFQMGINSGASKCSNWVLQNNVINISGTAKALKIGNSDHDSGGGVCDYNTYQNNSGLGAVRNDADVQSLAELQAAWADYDVTTNDAHSTVV